MGLFSKLGKNKQEAPSQDSGYYTSADDQTALDRARSKRASSADGAAVPRRSREREAEDPILPEKKRARRRLVGAVALALAVAIGLPMVLDSEPKQLAADVDLRIPSKDKPGDADAPADSRPVAPGAALDSSEEIVSVPARPAAAVAAIAAPAAPAFKPAPAVAPPVAAARTEPRAEAAHTDIARDDGAKAKARAEADALAKAEAKLKAEARLKMEAKAKADSEAKAEAKARLEAEHKDAERKETDRKLAKAKAEAEAETKAKAEARAETERKEFERKLADLKAKAEAERKETERKLAKAEADAKARTKAEADARAETERKLAEAKAAKPAKDSALSEDARALAILEGKNAARQAAADGGQKFVLQVAALTDQDKIDELRDKLKKAGISSFTQKTPSGDRTRIRVGPFGSKEEAEKVRAKLTAMGLSGRLEPV